MESWLYGGKCAEVMNFLGNLPETTSMSMQSLKSRHMKTLFTINRLRSLGMAENSMGKMSLQYAAVIFIDTHDFYIVNMNVNHVLRILEFLFYQCKKSAIFQILFFTSVEKPSFFKIYFLAVQKLGHFSNFIF